MSKIDNLYSAANYYNNSVQQKRKEKNASKAVENEQAEVTKKTGQTNQVKISDKAQAVLDRLKEKYGNMDFMVADFRNGDDAKSILSRGTKEFSVLFSPEELEKMANDSEYEQQVMNRIDGAIKMSEEINNKFGFESGFGKDTEKGELVRFGVSFNSDGTMSYFAELEKTTAKQKERIEESREQKAKEKREAKKEEYKPTKKTTVEASSMEELFEKINNIDWDKIEDEKRITGDKFDFSV